MIRKAELKKEVEKLQRLLLEAKKSLDGRQKMLFIDMFEFLQKNPSIVTNCDAEEAFDEWKNSDEDEHECPHCGRSCDC